MAPALSVQSHAALFGVECDLTTHSEHLLAAECFFGFRKVMEKRKTSLASLTVRQFKNHRTPFVEKVTKCIKEDDLHHQLLMPLITEDPTINGLKRFILACFALSARHAEDLQTRGLARIFPQLVVGIVDAVTIPPETMRAIVDTIQGVCEETIASQSTNNTLGHSLRDILDRVGSINMSSNNPERERPTKRARLHDAELRIRASSEDGSIEPLEFSQEILDAAENEVLNLNESPELAHRKIIGQFARAKADRIVGVFGISPLFEAMKTSRQWRWERAQDVVSLHPQGQTNCIIALLPNSDVNDFSFVIKVGNRTGWAIIEYLQYAESIEPTVNT